MTKLLTAGLAGLLLCTTAAHAGSRGLACWTQGPLLKLAKAYSNGGYASAAATYFAMDLQAEGCWKVTVSGAPDKIIKQADTRDPQVGKLGTIAMMKYTGKRTELHGTPVYVGYGQ